jgi:tetratricopeptide (TPR) repeat protein
MKRASVVVVGLIGFLASTRAIAGGDPQVCARKLEVALEKPTPAAAEVFLKQGYADCGDGHGFLAAMAIAAAAQGDVGRAGDLCLRELQTPDPTERAVEVLLALLPRSRPTFRQKFLALGITADSPLNLPQEGMQLDRLVRQVYCEGVQTVGVTASYDAKTEITRHDIECPRGKKTSRFVRYGLVRPGSTAKAKVRAIDRLIEDDVQDKFGISSVAELRDEVSGPPTADRSRTWLLSSLSDLPRIEASWALLLKKNPNDLEAIIGLAWMQFVRGDFDQALKTLRAADEKKVELVDTRGSRQSPSHLFSLQCKILARQNKLNEAARACEKAIELGSKRHGPIQLAEILFLQGKYEEALVHVDNGLKEDERSQRGWIIAALINQKLGRKDAAKERFDGSYGLSATLGASLDDKRTPAEWVAMLDRIETRATAFSLAECGHYYLDLELPKLSQACFAAAEKIDRNVASALRLEHQAETDAPAALKASKALLGTTRDATFLRIVARAHAHAGAPHDGIPALREALYKTAPWELPDELIRTVCVDVPLAECMKLSPDVREGR